MKYVIVLGDGMADLPVEELQGLTPLEFARTPCMDSLAAAHISRPKVCISHFP